MTTVRVRGEVVRKFILNQIKAHPRDIVRLAAEKFKCTRQAIHQHLQRLIDEGAVTSEGATRAKVYRLAPLVTWQKTYNLAKTVAEDVVWRDDVLPSLGKLPDNVIALWHFGVTEMFNNAIDHSGGTRVTVKLEKTALSATLTIADNGVGIFKKIQSALGLLDERHAVLELAKGKLTTDPRRHTGEGIFFSSRMFDEFAVLSGDVFFAHEFNEPEDWILTAERHKGTSVHMVLNNHTARTTKKVFEMFTNKEDYGFTKTVVPVKLLQYGDENLVSRSQAKRLLSRFDRFRTVVLDFSGVASIGHAFADEVFRVFPLENPKVELLPISANSAVKRVILRARSAGVQSS